MIGDRKKCFLEDVGRIGFEELSLWLAWYRKLDPSLEEQKAKAKNQRWNMAMILSEIRNNSGLYEERSVPEDFLPETEPEIIGTEEDLFAMLKMAYGKNKG